jgi:hypothetical protein
MQILAPCRSLASRTRAVVALGLLTGSIACVGPLHIKGGGNDAEERLRIDAIRRAEVWRPTNIASLDLARGPDMPGSFAPGATVSCNYVDKKMSGRSPKFTCAIRPKDEVKVKYGRTNGEVYAEVAATRLLWALGFGADSMYPVRVTCRGCPRDLRKEGKVTGRHVVFDPAAIERKMKGTELEWDDKVGWSWSELDLVESAPGPSQRAQRDALKLVAVLLQHTDSKTQQQRLLCLDEPASKKPVTCKRPFMMINDLGLTFGHSNLFNRNSQGSANFEKWSEEPVWQKPETCEANLAGSLTGTLKNPVIREPGRKFLADLLVQLTDKQLTDLFMVARLPARARAADQPEGDSVREWVTAFKAKRDQIVNHRCPDGA